MGGKKNEFNRKNKKRIASHISVTKNNEIRIECNRLLQSKYYHYCENTNESFCLNK